MQRILDITQKDLLQLLRDRKSFLFLLIMPVVFTLLFGYAFGGFGGGQSDPRLPVGFRDEDRSALSRALHDLLASSEVIRLQEDGSLPPAELEASVSKEDLAAAVIVPRGYGRSVQAGKPARLVFIGDADSPAGTSIESELLTSSIRLESAVRTALVLEQVAGDRAPYDYAFEQALAAWEDPPISVKETTSTAVEVEENGNGSLAHTSPGMMLQFSIAGLLVAAQVIVNERKSRTLQRMLTTATGRVHILFGHYLALLALILSQFILLLAFGQLILKLDYLHAPAATLLVALCAALCIAALGLLIGTLARTEEQAIIFSLIPMFVLAGLGGAWVPLEVTGPTFQTIGHLSPVAWAMDGFKNITVRGLGLEAALLPAAALLGYALLFFAVATWRFYTAEEK
ncbi:MAG TPA: ABC transporter permease [Anaerolineales bacterium]|nr:ABC transporter permease [Anaerolineales bacterium]